MIPLYLKVIDHATFAFQLFHSLLFHKLIIKYPVSLSDDGQLSALSNIVTFAYAGGF